MTPLTSAEAPSTQIQATDGATARIHLDGGHVTSWIPAGGEEQLFVSARARFGPGYAIRGGVPICWPQFGMSGPLRQHGFARLSRWTVAHTATTDAGARAVLQLTESEASRAEWPYAFQAELAVTVVAQTLRLELTVNNTDAQSFAFTAAMHPYFLVRDAFAVHVEGLTGVRYRDALRDGAVFDERGEAVAITGHLDRVYLGAPDALALREPHRTLQLRKLGFADAVVWNPGAEGTRSREDFVPGEEQRMVCVEAAAVQHPIVLAPGAQWTGVQEMTVD
jgi:glucose-6-phosphate 1-epimerase